MHRTWLFTVPDGWYANIQPAGSRISSCTSLHPSIPAANLRDGFFAIPEDVYDSAPYAIYVADSREPIEEMLTGVAINSGVKTIVRVTANEVRSDHPTPNASFELVKSASNPNLQMVRFRAVMAEDVGYSQRGNVDYGFIVTNPAGGTIRIARTSHTTLSESVIAPALDTLIQTFAFKDH